MRTLLRNVKNGLYFQGPDRWTEDLAKAHDFKLIDRALKFVERWRLAHVELAFAFSGWKDGAFDAGRQTPA